jgi:hypothetical protein
MLFLRESEKLNGCWIPAVRDSPAGPMHEVSNPLATSTSDCPLKADRYSLTLRHVRNTRHESE